MINEQRGRQIARMMAPFGRTLVCAALVLGAFSPSWGEELLLADGESWPGQMWRARGAERGLLMVRPGDPGEGMIPRVRSVAVLPTGQVVFCSGLDRFVMEWTPAGERVWHHGGYLARQVRTDSDGTLYWSGLETPVDGNPLPDGFIYTWDAARGEPRTVLTFSQGDVGHDWWGTFDVHQGRIYVGTLRGQTSIYDVTEPGAVRLVSRLPISASAFRYAADGSLWACDGAGKLYRFEDPARPEQWELVLESARPMVDFAFR